MPRGQVTVTTAFAKVSGREGGIVSGMVRRERAFQRYLLIASEKGIYEALRVCRRESYQYGWTAAYRKRLTREKKAGMPGVSVRDTPDRPRDPGGCSGVSV